MDERAAAEMVQDANVLALTNIRNQHGDKIALAMSRGLLTASAYMIRLIAGSRVAALELYSMADRFAVEE